MGLLDAFNRGAGALAGSTGNYGGLLADDEVKAINQQRQLALAAQLLDAGGWSQNRTSTGQALGRGIAAANQAGGDAQSQALQAALLKKQLASAGAKTGKPLAIMRDGKPVYVTPEEAIGGEPYSPVQRSEAPAVLQEYAQYSADEKAAGRKPASYMDWLPERAKSNVGSPFQVVDFMGGRAVTDKRLGSIDPRSTAAQEAAGAATIADATTTATTAAKQTAEAAFDLPRVEQNTAAAIKTLKDLRSHKGLKSITGLYSLAPIVPGTDQAGADAMAKQVEGKVFLEAFNTLKGGGVITDTEGAKATAAIGRLQRAQKTEDYQAAIDDLVSVLENGVKLAQKKAKKTGDSSAPTETKPAAKRKYNPATGKIE